MAAERVALTKSLGIISASEVKVGGLYRMGVPYRLGTADLDGGDVFRVTDRKQRKPLPGDIIGQVYDYVYARTVEVEGELHFWGEEEFNFFADPKEIKLEEVAGIVVRKRE